MNFADALKLVRKSRVGNSSASTVLTIVSTSGLDSLATMIEASIVELFGCSSRVVAMQLAHRDASWLPSELKGDEFVIRILFPWDLFPSLSWRLEDRSIVPSHDQIMEEARQLYRHLISLQGHIIYFDFPFLAFSDGDNDEKSLRASLNSLFVASNSTVIGDSSFFDLARMLTNDFPFASKDLYRLSSAILGAIEFRPCDPCKVLVTDADFTLWAGLVSEDGPDGISFSINGSGAVHSLYQQVLKYLQEMGILIGIVSRNSESVLLEGLGRLELFSIDDFAFIRAGYEPKSLLIREELDRLNLHADSVVFVDDNLIEISEVRTALRGAKCLQFDGNCSNFPAFADRLLSFFAVGDKTDEDNARLHLYKLRDRVNSFESKFRGDHQEFLRALKMRLIEVWNPDDYKLRALQLINKTNQFNNSGRRLSDANFNRLCEQENVDFVCWSLSDRFGEHGVVSVAVIQNGVMLHWVVSCRVFERGVEQAILGSLLKRNENLKLMVVPTQKNAPFLKFIDEMQMQALIEGVECNDLKLYAPSDLSADYDRLIEVVSGPL